ncbi:hypothetical protein Q5P01_015282 [Channa striata]|uniref:Cilia- and flagella-associated protein 157 n=1 Tax=Channa striata TaxID=64152 RepID=A0AA88SG77_CHASR|nr:hypothetical protein Q5P01_015282 [Channa striata]
MPKKKADRGGDKGGDKVGDRPDGSKTTPKQDSPVKKSEAEARRDELSHVTQLGHVHERVDRYQVKSDELGKQNEALKAQCSLLEKEKKDVAEFLKRSLLEKEDEVDELTERLDGQRQAAEKERDALQLQHQQLRQELLQRIEELTKENLTLVARLDSLEEFQKQKEQLMSNMESLEKQLASQKEEHRNHIHNVEMKSLLEKKRLEEEVQSFEAAMAAEVQQLVDQKVPETTRLALQDNAELKSQLGELSGQTKVLMRENSALQERKTQLSLDVDILEKMLSEMTRQSCIRKKVVEQLTDKCQQLQAEQKDDRQELKQLQAERKGLLAEVEALRLERASLSERCSKNAAEAARLEAALEAERRRRSRMKSTMQEAVDALREALMEEPDERDSVVHWKKLMQKLLLALDKHRKSTAEESEAAGAVNLDPALSFQFQLARYRPGDLGLVPPPAPKHKGLPLRTGAGSTSTGAPLFRKPYSQRTASSITLTDSAAGFLSSKHSVTKLKKLT